MINTLTTFRFIAAFMVFLFHLEMLSQFQLGAAGVQFFFILSGFILAYNYSSKLTEINRDSLMKFYRARFAKIYPVHVLTFLIAAPFVIMTFNPEGLYLIKLAFMSIINLLLVQSFVPNEGTYFNFNGVSWTLSVEAVFYLTFPFLLWMFSKLKVAKHTVFTISVIGVVCVILFLLNMSLDENNEFLKWLLHIFPVARLFEFSTGIILGLFFVKRNSGRGTSKYNIVTSLEFLSVGAFFAALWFSVGLDVGIVRGVFFVPVWCLLIYVFAHQGGVLSKLLSNKLLVYLGEISFSFYMIHQLIIRYYDFLGLDPSYKFYICLVLSLAISAIMFNYYEEPLRKRLRYGAKRKQESRAIIQTPV